jgi:hypothetical protein
MTPATVSELKVGDVFCREGRLDTPYRVLALRFVPIYGFFGNLYDTIEVTVEHRLTGRASMNLSPDESVWLVDPADEAAAPARPAARSRWMRRRKGV